MRFFRTMKIIQFSDPHAGGGAEDWLAYLDKRWVGVFNYTFRRRFQHDLTKLEKAVQYILKVRPDVAICTGDLTSTGQPGEFEQVRKVLQPLRDSTIPLIYVPGNHDCYVTRAKCVAAVNEMVEYLSRGDYRFCDMPFVRHYGECDFLVFNTARPSNLLCSWGFTDPADCDFLERECAKEKKCPRILVNHYPIFEDHHILRVRHRLFGEKRIAALIKSGAIDLSLCGHVHKITRRLSETGRGENIAGSVTRNGSLAEIDYDAAQDRFLIRNIAL